MESANILIYQLPGSNAIDVAKAVHARRWSGSSRRFPPGMEYAIPFDTTKFVDAAISEVYQTLARRRRAGAHRHPASSCRAGGRCSCRRRRCRSRSSARSRSCRSSGSRSTCSTLFGLVLAIGIVVDDAIVIVENASHHIEQGMSPREATIQAMSEVTGPVIAITLVLMAVFLPTAFLGGITGAAVPPVRPDHRGDGPHQRHQRADAQAGPVPPVARRPPPAAEHPVTRAFNAVYGRSSGLHLAASAAWSASGGWCWSSSSAVAVVTAWWYQQPPTGLPAHGGPGVRHHRRPAARRARRSTAPAR